MNIKQKLQGSHIADAQTSMEQDGSGCIGVVATRVKQDTWLVLNTDLIYHQRPSK
jgi:hypothetical protein